MISIFDIYNGCGMIGAVCIVGNYGLMQWRRDYNKTLQYSLLNALAAILMGVSLWQYFNMPAVFINFGWFVISIYGAYRCLKYERRTKKAK